MKESVMKINRPECLCLILLLLQLTPVSTLERFEVHGPAQPVVAIAGEDVVLPCYLKPNISAVDLRIEWFRVQTDDPLVHLYRDHEDRNENQVPSYRGRTSLFPEELRNGNVSLKVKNVIGSDNGEYKCFIRSVEWYDDSSINVFVEGEMFNRAHPWKVAFAVIITLAAVCIIGCAVLIHRFVKLRTKRGQLREQLELISSQLTVEKMCRRAELLKAQRYGVDVTLDPKTAHPVLVLSEDGKQVRRGVTWQDIPDNPERFEYWRSVLGKEGFSSGRRYWEVQVGDKTGWVLGVARESISRKGFFEENPHAGLWALRLWSGNKYEALSDPPVSLRLSVKLRKVGVFVDYEGGRVSFYSVEDESHIYTFTGYKFTEKLYPYFWLSYQDSIPLIICPVRDTD